MPLTLKQCVLLLKSEGRHFLSVFTFENLIDSCILTIISDTGTDSDCTICVTNNGDFAHVDKDFDLSDIKLSVSREGTVDLTDFDSLSESYNNNGDVDVHVDDNNNTYSNVLKPVVLQYVFVQFFTII